MRPQPANPSAGRLLWLAALALVLAACQSAPPKFACSVPNGFKVEAAFAHARSDLVHPECQFQFDNYVDTLLEIAGTDPKPENKQQFSGLFSWARDHGVLSQIQAEQYYRRYFTPFFISLDSDYSNCSSTCRNRAQLARNMKNELRDKDRGLLKAAADRAGYLAADKEYNQLLTLIDATCLACERSQ